MRSYIVREKKSNLSKNNNNKNNNSIQQGNHKLKPNEIQREKKNKTKQKCSEDLVNHVSIFKNGQDEEKYERGDHGE